MFDGALPPTNGVHIYYLIWSSCHSEVALLQLCPFLQERFRNHKMAELALNRCSQEENTPSVKEAAEANKDKQ